VRVGMTMRATTRVSRFGLGRVGVGLGVGVGVRRATV
jgi:hypothetical protein